MSSIPSRDWFGLLDDFLASSGFVQRGALIDLSRGTAVAFFPGDFKVAEQYRKKTVTMLTVPLPKITKEESTQMGNILR